MNLVSLVKKNSIDYNEIRNKSYVSINKEKKYLINVIIGFRGRTKFILPILNSFKSAIKYYNEIYNSNKQKICLTFIEHDLEPYHKDTLKPYVNYIWTLGNTTDEYNRGFVYNFGVRYSNKAKYYLLHDIDILVKENFFVELFENLKESRCIQTYGNRRVLYLSKNVTDGILNGKIDYNSLDEEFVNTNRLESEIIPNAGSKGGSILVEKDLFFDVGGFDPELFNGYAPEDQLFWEKALFLLNKIDYADNPPIDMFHLWHPTLKDSNSNLDTMQEYVEIFKKMEHNDKLAFIKLKKDALKKP